VSMVIDSSLIDQLSHDQIRAVTFYKRDEITTDLICCEVDVAGQIWFFHEELAGWQMLVAHLEQLPGFKTDWYAAVVQPTFARSETIAFTRD